MVWFRGVSHEYSHSADSVKSIWHWISMKSPITAYRGGLCGNALAVPGAGRKNSFGQKTPVAVAYHMILKHNC